MKNKRMDYTVKLLIYLCYRSINVVKPDKGCAG